MSRRRKADKREIIPDPKFGDVVLTKFMNSIMYEGKKSAAERIVYGALDQKEKKTKQNPVELFHEALRNVMPALEVRSRRVGGNVAREYASRSFAACSTKPASQTTFQLSIAAGLLMLPALSRRSGRLL